MDSDEEGSWLDEVRAGNKLDIDACARAFLSEMGAWSRAKLMLDSTSIDVACSIVAKSITGSVMTHSVAGCGGSNVSNFAVDA